MKSSNAVTNFSNEYKPRKIDEKIFFEKLKEQIIASQENKFYSDLCQKNDYTVPEEINTENLEFVPYFTTNNYKISKNLFYKIIKVPPNQIAVWNSSSSTSGDPSLVGRTMEDLETIHYNALKCFDEFLNRKAFEKTGMCFNFSPNRLVMDHLAHNMTRSKMKELNTYSQQMDLIKKYKQAIFFFTELMNKPWETIPTHSYYLVRIQFLKALWVIIKTHGIRAAFVLDWKFMLKKIKKYKDGPIQFGGSPLLMNTVLEERMIPDNISFDLSETGYVGSGGGGWDGIKAQAKLKKVDKTEFIERFKKVFNIDYNRMQDIYAFTESPVLFGGHWSPNYQDYIHHCPDYARIIVRNLATLEPVREGEQGVLEVITPFGVNGSINMAIVVDDIIELISKEKCPDCGYEGTAFRVIGRTKDAPGQSCSSIINWF